MAETASMGPQTRFFGILAVSGSPKKRVPDPKKPKNAKKSKFRQNGAVSSKIFGKDPMANVLRLTGGQFFFDFGSMGRRYGRAKKKQGGGGGSGVGVGGALHPTPDQ